MAVGWVNYASNLSPHVFKCILCTLLILVHSVTARTRGFPRGRREEKRRRKLFSFLLIHCFGYIIKLIKFQLVLHFKTRNWNSWTSLADFFFLSIAFGICSADPFAKKDWYDIKAPSVFTTRNIGKTLVTRTQGTKVFYMSLMFLLIAICAKCLENKPLIAFPFQDL